jgi:hypothetical protein
MASTDLNIAAWSERVSPQLAMHINRKLRERGIPHLYDEKTGTKLDRPKGALRPARITPNPERDPVPCRKCGSAFKPKGPTSRVCGSCKAKAGMATIAPAFRKPIPAQIKETPQ